MLEATELKEQELRAHFTEEIKSLGLAIDSQAFDQLLIKSGFDFSEIQKNLEFLKTYKGASSITISDIEEAIPKTLQDNLFDLIQMILKKEIDSARSLVKDLRLQGEDEIKLLGHFIESVPHLHTGQAVEARGTNRIPKSFQTYQS